MTFLLNDKDFASFKADIPNSGKSFEVRKVEHGQYCVLEHSGNSVNELMTVSKLELKTLWQMLSTDR